MFKGIKIIKPRWQISKNSDIINQINSKKNMSLSWKQVRKKTGIKQKFKDYFQEIGKPFNVNVDWYQNMLKEIKQI